MLILRPMEHGVNSYGDETCCDGQISLFGEEYDIHICAKFHRNLTDAMRVTLWSYYRSLSLEYYLSIEEFVEVMLSDEQVRNV